MKQYFAKLQWKSFRTLIDNGDAIPFTELDKYADHTFDNGIAIRISTGKMAHTTHEFPYEMNILHPVKGNETIPNLNKHGIAVTMHKLENEIIINH